MMLSRWLLLILFSLPLYAAESSSDTSLAPSPTSEDTSLAEIQDALDKTGMFADLTHEELSMIATIAEFGTYHRGDYLTQQNQVGNRLFLIMLGSVDIYIDPTIPPIATLEAGSLLGEMGFIDNVEAAANALAASDKLQTIEISYAELATLLETEPRIGYTVMRNFARDLSDKLRRSNLAN